MKALPILALAALAAACGGGRDSDSATARPAPADTARITIEGVSFPAEMAGAPPAIVEAYVFAAKHPEVLTHIPCYCGCEKPPFEHRSNYDCFVNAIDTTGEVPRVDPDPMGFS